MTPNVTISEPSASREHGRGFGQADRGAGLTAGLNGGNIRDLFGSARMMGDYKKLGMVSATVRSADVARFGADSRIVAIDLDRPVAQMATADYSVLQQVTGADVVDKTYGVD